MKMNCLHCGHAFGVDDSYSDYEGLLKCPTCGGLLDARIEDGMIRSVRPGSLHPAAMQQRVGAHSLPHAASPSAESSGADAGEAVSEAA